MSNALNRPRRERFKAHIARRFLLRFHMALLLLGVALSGLIANRFLWALGIERFHWRYPAAVLVSYLTFFGLVRLWLRVLFPRRRRHGSYVDGSELTSKDAATSAEESGRFGGAGASGGWAGPASGSAPDAQPASGLGAELDGDAALLLIFFGVLIAGILGAGGYLIYSAPEILAEALFEFALTSGLLRAARDIDRPGWAGSIFKRTWVPFTIVLVFSIIFALMALKLCPSATRVSDFWEKGCSSVASRKLVKDSG